MNNTEMIKKLKSMLMVSKNGSLPVLQNVVMENVDYALTITSTDLDTFTSITMPCSSADFVAVVNHRNLIAVLMGLPKKTTLTFTVEATTLIIHTIVGEFLIAGVNRDSYPSLPTMPEEETVFVHNSVIDQMNEVLPFVADKSEIRASLTGILCDKETGKLVGTNGHFLGLVKNVPEMFAENVIISADTVKYLTKLRKASDYYGKKSEVTAIQTAMKGTYCYFIGEDFTVISRVIEGPYPPYEKVIPMNHKNTITLNAETVLNIPLSVLNQATFQILIKNVEGKAVLYGENNGGMIWEMEAGTTTEGHIAFSAKLLKTIVKFIGTNPVIIQTTDSHTAVTYEDETKLALLMPVRLPEEV